MIARDLILNEIKRVAALNGGVAPGVRAFANHTGITQGQWAGRYWTKWSDALLEAGFKPNTLQPKLDGAAVLRQVANLALELGKVPTNVEMRMKRRSDPTFPNDKTVGNHFKSRSGLVSALRDYSEKNNEFRSILDFLPNEITLDVVAKSDSVDGWVYLLKSGENYKIGRSENLEKRVKQINIAMPEATILFHAISTDDPSGIEAYWHRRFADRRLNGEWFRLTKSDIAAFKKRKFQ